MLVLYIGYIVFMFLNRRIETWFYKCTGDTKSFNARMNSHENMSEDEDDETIVIGENPGIVIGENPGIVIGENPGIVIGENPGIVIGENPCIVIGENPGIVIYR